MCTSSIPALPDVLRDRANRLAVLISENTRRIAEISTAVVVLQTNNVSVEVKIFNTNAMGAVYTGPMNSDIVRNAILSELVSEHQARTEARVTLINDHNAISAQLTAMGADQKGDHA